MYCDTAEIAGGDKRIREWTRMKETVAKLEVLVKLHRVLWALGASSLLDERLAPEGSGRGKEDPPSSMPLPGGP